MSLCSTLFLKPCFPNQISQTQRREIENGPSCSLRRAVRNLTQPGALCFVCRVSPLWRHHRAAPPSVIPASWHLRTALATVSSLFGKIVACSKTMIKVHDGNKKKKKSIKYQSLDCSFLSVSGPNPEKNQQKKWKMKPRGEKLNFLMYAGKDDYPTFRCGNK